MALSIFDVQKRLAEIGFELIILHDTFQVLIDLEKDKPTSLFDGEIFAIAGGKAASALDSLTRELVRERLALVVTQNKLRAK